MKDYICCGTCGEECEISGEYPKFFAHCDFCNTYAKGFNPTEYAGEVLSSRIDDNYDQPKDLFT